jgi:hypothetical protein
MKKLFYLALTLLMVTFLLVGCGGDDASQANPTAMLSATDRVEPPGSTPPPPTSTTEPSPTPTATPTVVPLQDPAWTGANVADICLDVSFSCPQVDPPFSLPIEPIIGELLEGMGLKVTTAGGVCDATLTITLAGDAYTRSYTDSQNEKVSCYTGASVEGTISLSSDSYPTIEQAVSNSYSPQFTTFCPDEPSSGASWRDAWMPAVAGSIFELWGSSAAGSGLMMDNNLMQEQAAAWLAKQEPEDMLGALPALISALETSAGEARAQVAGTIAKIGPPAKDAFPTLLEILEHAMELDKESPVSVNMSIYGYAVETAIASIAGITRANAPDDVRFWQLWWEAQELAEAGDIDGLLAMMEGDADPWARRHAASALGSLTDAATEAIPALIDALNHDDEEVREAAAETLGQIGLEDEDAIRALVAKLDDRDIGLTLRRVLREIGVAAIPALVEKASENKGEPSHYTNASKSALDLLKGITGEDYDGSAWSTYKWTQTVDDFLERCWDFYNTQGGG